MVAETQLPTSKHFRLEKLAEGVYAALAIDGGGAMCNAGIVDLGDRILVFDTFWTPEASQDLLTAAEQRTGHAVVYIVNSHYNADHVNGNQVFAPATTIISTSRTRELLIERGNGFLHWAREHLAEEVHEDEKKLAAETNEDRRQQMALDLETTRALLHALPTLELRLPNFTFEHRLDLHGPARSIELRCLGGGHTESDAFLYLPQDHILFTGDLLFTQMHPSMWHDQPETWISILARMEELKTDAVVPGHGSLGTREDVTLLRQYLTWLWETARAVIKREGLADDLVILICVLHKNFEMRETHHRPQTLFVISQLTQTPAEFVGQEIKRGIEAVVNILLASFFPHMRNLVDVWAVGGLLDQANVAWDDQLSGAMPPSIPLPASP